MSDKPAEVLQLQAELSRLRARVAELETAQARQQDHARREMNRALAFMPAVVYTCGPGPDYPTTSISDSVEQLLGYRAQQFYDDPKFWEKRIHEDDRQFVLGRLLKIEETNDCSYRYRFRHANGEYRWLDDKICTHRDESGDVVGLIGSWFDISDRVEAERNFATSEERFRAITANLPGAVFSYEIDAQGRREPIYTGPGFVDLIGREATDRIIAGDVDSFFERIHPDDLERLRRAGHFEASFEDAIDQEYRLLNENGVYRWVRAIARPLIRENGVQRWHGMLIDVTKRREAEQRLSESEERYRELFDRVPVGLYRTAPDGTILEVNAALVRMLGFPDRATLLQTNVQSFYVCREDRQRLLEKAEREGTALDVEFRVRRRDGREIWIRANTRTVRDSAGDVLFYEGHLEDVTSRRQAEATIHHERDRAQAYLDIAANIMVAIDANEKVLLINRKGCEVLGASETDIVGSNWFDRFLPASDREYVRGLFRDVIERRSAVSEYYENRIVTRDGRERTIAWHNSLLHDDAGNIVATLSSGEDITDRREAEEALRKSEEIARKQLLELDNLYWTAPIGLCHLDPNLRYARINVRLAEINGLPVEEHIGRTIHDVIPDLAPAIEPILQRVMQSGQPVLGVETRGTTIAQPGVERQWLVSYVPLRTQDGRILGVNTVVSEITELKRIEEDLRRFEHIVSTTSDHMSFVDAEYVYRTVNDAYVAAHCTTRADIIGKSIPQILGKRIFEKTVKARFDRCLSGERIDYQAWFHFKGKGRCFMDVVYSPHHDENGVITGVTVSARDITERKRAEEAKERLEAQLRQSQKLQAVGQLAAGVSHDFNSLLTVVMGHTELMLRRLAVRSDEARDKDAAALQQILEAVERGRNVVKKLLTFGRTRTFRPQELCVNRVIEDMTALLDGMLGPHVELHTHLANNLHTVRADVGQLEQVLMNLVLNARDAMPSGGDVRIETANVSEMDLSSIGHEDRCGDHILLAVHDTGEGMNRSTKEHLFEPFFTTKPVDKGSGLGLSIVHGIVEQTGGFIDVGSTPGMGTSFRIYFPRAEHRGETSPPA